MGFDVAVGGDKSLLSFNRIHLNHCVNSLSDLLNIKRVDLDDSAKRSVATTELRQYDG